MDLRCVVSQLQKIFLQVKSSMHAVEVGAFLCRLFQNSENKQKNQRSSLFDDCKRPGDRMGTANDYPPNH